MGSENVQCSNIVPGGGPSQTSMAKAETARTRVRRLERVLSVVFIVWPPENRDGDLAVNTASVFRENMVFSTYLKKPYHP
jgi:hypothetical protein